MSNIYAARIGDRGMSPVSGYMVDEGTERALAQVAAEGMGKFHIVIDDDDMVDGYRVLASGWYDASEDTETPDEFAARLFAEARTTAE